MVSPRKSTSALSIVPEEHGTFTPISRKSYESIYSAASSRCSAAYRCKASGNRLGTMGALRQPSCFIPATSEVRQRVLSARRLRIKNYQNQLADAYNRIAELSSELRLLSSLHKRQNNALAKYESSNAELPQLLHSHAEELRMWQTKYRTLQSAHRELESKLKQKENLILSLSDQNKYFSQLNKDKGLEERQRLTDKVATLEVRLQEKDNDMKLLARKMQLDIRNYKQQLAAEQKKTKEALLKLEKLHFELSTYRKLAEVNMTDKLSAICTSKLPMNHLRSIKLKSTERIKALPSTGPGDITSNSSSSMSSPRLELIERASASATETIVCRNDDIAESQGKTTRKVVLNSHSAHRTTNSNSDRGSAAHSPCNKLLERTNSSMNTQTEPRGVCAKPKSGCGVSNTKYNPEENPQNSELVIEEKVNIFRSSEDAYDDEDYEDCPEDTDEESFVNDEVPKVNSDRPEELKETNLRATATYSVYSSVEQKQCTPTTTIAISHEESIDTKQQSSPQAIVQPSKGDVSSIRKQISDDYKQREAFLDVFCRQATSTVCDKSGNQKRNSIAIGDNALKSSRRNRLLAVLKAIDDDPNQS